MAHSFYFKLDLLSSLVAEKALPGETIEGIVFTQGLDEYGKPLLYPFFRIRDKNGSIYLKEPTSATRTGCPYPPPCA